MHGLYGWLRRHAHLVDGTVAFAFVLAGLTQSTLMRPKWVAIPVLAAVAGPTIFRRAHPGRAFWFTLGAAAIQLVTGVGVTRRTSASLSSCTPSPSTGRGGYR